MRHGQGDERGQRQQQPPRPEPPEAESGDAEGKGHGGDPEAQVAERQVARVEGGDAGAMPSQPLGVAAGYGRTIPSAVHR